MAQKLRYSDIEDSIDLDQLYEAIGFEPTGQRGEWDTGPCVFPENHSHGDTTGKFAVNRESRIYNCWVCGGGDLLSLAMELHPEFNTQDATHWLKQFTRLVGHDKFLAEFEKDLEDVETRVATMPYFNARVLDKWVATLQDDDEMLEWIALKWTIQPETLLDFKVGYDPDHSRRVKDETYVGPAIILPVFWKDRLVGWQERWMAPEEERPKWVPKYTNTDDLPRNEIIFNYDRALRDPVYRKLPVFVHEAGFTALAFRSAGLNAVATFGSSASDAQKRLLRRFANGVLLCPDHDVPKKKEAIPTGIKWQRSLAEYLERFIPVKLLPPPVEAGPKGDAADLMASNPRAFIRWLGQAEESIDV